MFGDRIKSVPWSWQFKKGQPLPVAVGVPSAAAFAVCDMRWNRERCNGMCGRGVSQSC